MEKYDILERLAVGGMGEVFLARQRGAGGFARTVVIKHAASSTRGSTTAGHPSRDDDDGCHRRDERHPTGGATRPRPGEPMKWMNERMHVIVNRVIERFLDEVSERLA